MKRISKLFLSLICILGFATTVSAASNTITTNISGEKYEYMPGLKIYYNTASSYNLYVLNYDTYYNTRTTLSDPTEADSGFAYIINNSNVTNSSYKNYYIAQAAILWYQDYLNGNNANITASMKEAIANNTGDTVCYYINKLVNNAKKHGSSSSSIKFIDKEITFTRNGSYYYSNVIDVETNNLNSTPTVRLYNAPSSASIINNSVSRDGEGSFQIRIPISNLDNYNNDDFEVYIKGTGEYNTVYKYTNYGISDAIYGRVYSNTSTSIEDSLVAKIDGTNNTSLRIYVLDKNEGYINGIKFNIYSGNCVNSTCYSDDLVHTFTSKSSYTELENILSSGTYTIVTKTNSNYDLPEKKAFTVDNTNSTQTLTIRDNDYENNENISSEKLVRIYNSPSSSSNIIKIYRYDGVLMNSFRGDIQNYSIYLSPNTNYYIIDTDNTLKVFFDVTEDGDIYVQENGKKVKRVSIDLDNYLVRYENNENNIYNKDEENNINNKDEENNNNNIVYDKDGTIHLDNLNGNESIDITNEVNTTTDVKIEWLSNIIDCPITSLSSTLKYVVGAIVLGIGTYLVVRNVKKSKNNI